MSTIVYRIYGTARRLLYVGVTNNYDRRMRAHSEKTWWRDVRHIETETYPTRAEALTAEAAAIKDERPLYNRSGNETPPAPLRPVPDPKPAGHGAWVTQPDALAYLGVTDRTLRRYVAAGQLPAYRLGPRLLRFRRSDLDALLRPVPVGGVAR